MRQRARVGVLYDAFWDDAFCRATVGAMRDNAQASVEIMPNGTALVTTATQDIGTGTYTVLALVVAEATGIPLDKIDVRLGDTTLPAWTHPRRKQMYAALSRRFAFGAILVVILLILFCLFCCHNGKF